MVPEPEPPARPLRALTVLLTVLVVAGCAMTVGWVAPTDLLDQVLAELLVLAGLAVAATVTPRR